MNSNSAVLSRLNLANQYLHSGKRDEAAAIYDEIAGLNPENAEVQVELGQLCSLFGAQEKAIAHYSRALELCPDDPALMGHLGIARMRYGELDAARELLQQAYAIDEQLPHVLYGLGIIHKEAADYEQARAFLEKALAFNPRDSLVLVSLAQTLTFLNDYEEAEALVHRALKLNKADENAQVVLGTILTETGRIDEAIRHYQKMIAGNNQVGLAYDNYARLKKFTADDKSLIKKAERVLGQGMPPQDRVGVHFALGKMYDDIKDYDKAFNNFRDANVLGKVGYDIARDKSRFKLVTRLFNANSIAEYAEFGSDSTVPVFIIGMPRSGTTLMERIIASHSQGAGAGELQVMSRIAHQLITDNASTSATRVKAELGSELAQGHASLYLGVLRQGYEDKSRVVDKLPGNYINLGLIASLFPKATIIHAQRDPLDTCLSCYFQAFGQVGWANDFESIVGHYKIYRDYMDYWRKVLPEGKILDVSYEKLTAEPAIEGRKMIEHCGLEWEADSLEFHQQEAVVRTVSQWQVRQPIYQSSKRRWINYAAHIQELANQLADYLEDDKDLLAEHGIQLKRRFKLFGLG